MITPDGVVAKLERQYPNFLRSRLRNESLFPLSLSVGTPPKKDFLELHRAIETLKSASKDKLGYGYVITWEQVNMRGVDRQTLPVRITVETENDYLRILRKKREFEDFLADVELICARIPELNTWSDTYPLDVIKYHGEWEYLLRVCEYFKAHPRPNYYIRELPIAVHTKFIEEHVGILRQLLDHVLPDAFIKREESDFARRYGLRYDEALVRFRLLDSTLQSKLNLVFDDLSVPISAFKTFDLSAFMCIIVENKMNFLTLPPLEGTIGIFGSGFKVEVLSQTHWLANCLIYYWGDLDAQGFQILSQLRGFFPHVASLMMDENTLAAFKERIRKGRETKIVELPYLTLPERILYEQLVVHNLRLEQEQIDDLYVKEQLQRLKR